MEQQKNQVLIDKTKNGKTRNWRGRKILCLKLADIFDELNYKVSLIDSVRSCGDTLNFIRDKDGNLKLYQAYFCKNKLCPLCNWRRSMKYAYQTSRIVDKAIEQYPKGRFIFLTLTVKNIPGNELKDELTRMSEGFRRLMLYKKVEKNMLGFLRATEVTHNEKRDDYHPHLHVLLFLKSTYFKGETNYLSQKDWSKLWSKAMKLDYEARVDVRAVKAKSDAKNEDGLRKAIFETAKYPTKPIELTHENSQVVDNLYKGLYKKRQLGFGGIFKTIRKELQLSDIENGDLIKTKDGKDLEISQGERVMARWNFLIQNYEILN